MTTDNSYENFRIEFSPTEKSQVVNPVSTLPTGVPAWVRRSQFTSVNRQILELPGLKCKDSLETSLPKPNG